MIEKVKRTDKPVYRIEFHDGTCDFYLDDHPGFKPEEKGRYFKAPEVKLLSWASK